MDWQEQRGETPGVYSKCVENEICPGFVNSSQESAAMFLQNVTKIIERMPETETGADNLHYTVDMVDRACELYRNNKMEGRSSMHRSTRSGTKSAKSSS